RGNVHWFWRALAVWATAALFIPVRAYDLAFLFPLATLLLLAGFRIARGISCRRARQEHAEAGPLGWAAVRFRLHDLFLLVLLVALVIVTFQAIPLPPAAAYGWQNWVAVAGWAALLATIWSLAYGCTVTRRPLAVAVLTSIAIAGASFALAALSNLRQLVLSSSLTA